MSVVVGECTPRVNRRMRSSVIRNIEFVDGGTVAARQIDGQNMAAVVVANQQVGFRDTIVTQDVAGLELHLHYAVDIGQKIRRAAKQTFGVIQQQGAVVALELDT